MRISVPRGTHIGAVHAPRTPPGPTPPEEPPLASDEEWVTDSESDSETSTEPRQQPPPQPHITSTVGMSRIQNSGIHADFY
jgi:hypothetical protein